MVNGSLSLSFLVYYVVVLLAGLADAFVASPHPCRSPNIHHHHHHHVVRHSLTGISRRSQLLRPLPTSAVLVQLQNHPANFSTHEKELDTTAGRFNPSNKQQISKMLWYMTGFFSSMVDEDSNRLYYMCLPQSSEQQKIHQHFPIRDLGAAWDATTALLFWKNHQFDNQGEEVKPDKGNAPTVGETTTSKKEFIEMEQKLEKAISGTLLAYSYDASAIEPLQDDRGVALSSTFLRESSTIAHSGLLLLALVGARRLSITEQPQQQSMQPQEATLIEDLTQGLLSMQRPDGAFRIHFSQNVADSNNSDNNVYRGIEFYPGEAMVALMDVYKLCEDEEESSGSSNILPQATQQAILSAMKQAFVFYDNYYRTKSPDVNYNIWQVQAFARLFYILKKQGGTTNNDMALVVVADYLGDMCHDIVTSTSWRLLSRGKSFYPNLQTVEIACGLDALAQGILVANTVSRHEDTHLFVRNAENAIEYLNSIQDLLEPGAVGYGGLGFGGLQVMEQRLDVTGHAIGALTKLCC